MNQKVIWCGLRNGFQLPLYHNLKKELLFVLKSFAVSIHQAAIFNFYVIKNTPSDAESREEQDDSKHKFVGGTTAKLCPNFHKGVVINTEEK